MERTEEDRKDGRKKMVKERREVKRNKGGEGKKEGEAREGGGGACSELLGRVDVTDLSHTRNNGDVDEEKRKGKAGRKQANLSSGIRMWVWGAGRRREGEEEDDDDDKGLGRISRGAVPCLLGKQHCEYLGCTCRRPALCRPTPTNNWCLHTDGAHCTPRGTHSLTARLPLSLDVRYRHILYSVRISYFCVVCR